MHNESKRFFIFVHFRDSSKTRLIESAKSLQKVMKGYFADSFKTAFVTQDAMGFFVKTSMKVHGINSALVYPVREKIHLSGQEIFSDPIITGDELLIFEIGDEFSVRNLGAAEGWLKAE